MSERRSKIKSVFIDPKLQVRYGALFMAVSILVHSVVTVIIVTLYSANMNSATPIPFPIMVAILVVLYLVIYGFSFVLGFLITHQLYGPLIRIENYLTSWKNGENPGELALRAGDDKRVQSIVQLLNDILKTRSH